MNELVLKKHFNYLILISLLYGVLLNNGFYGYNTDFYKEYHKENLFLQYPIFDRLGILIATLTVNKIHIGVGVTSFLLSFSTGLLLLTFFKKDGKNSLIYFFIIHLILIHSHPVIMSTSGAMRQGLMMSSLYFSLYFLAEKKYVYSFIFAFAMMFLHKGGLIFLCLYFSTLFLLVSLKQIKNFNILILTFSGILIFSLSSFGIYIKDLHTLNHRVIYGDFRFMWFTINFFYIFYFFFFYKKKDNFFVNFIKIFLFLHAFLSPSLLFIGLNWQYERINMVIGIALILVISTIFNKLSSSIFILTATGLYLFLTIYQGMYSIGLN